MRESKIKFKETGYQFAIKVLGMVAGAFLIAVSYNTLIIPHALLSGGVGGLSLILKYVFGVPVYVGIFLLNIPVFLWAFKELNRKFIFYSLIGTVAMIFAIPLTKPILPVPHLDLFLASVFSGVVGGAGIGIFLKSGASSGGTEIIAMIAKKKRNISVGTFAFICNMTVLLISLYFFELKIALYTSISMWVSGRVINAVIAGLNYNKSVMIISDKTTEIANRILKELHRGVTYLEGRGGYSGSEKLVIDCVVSHFEVSKVREIVFDVDPKAFMFLTETAEVSGKGFTW